MSNSIELQEAAVEDLLADRRHAILATNREDGPPQLSPVWFVWKGGALYVSTSEESIKARNIRRDGRISVCVDGGWGDFRYVTLSGEAVLHGHGTGPQQEMRWQIIRKYQDSDEAARAYYESAASERHVLVELRPERIVYEDFNR